MQDKYSRRVNVGLFILRLGIGTMFILHGYPKLMGGVAAWEGLGKAMGVFGITFMPQVWGFLAAFAECFGGVLLILGFFVRSASFFMLMTMIVAAAMHMAEGQGIMKASHAIEAGVVFLMLLIVGGGQIDASSLFKRKDGRG